MSERTTSSSWASGIVQALELGGVDCRQLFARLGLDYAALSDPDARFPQDGMTRLWQRAVALSGNPAIQLFGAGREQRIYALPPWTEAVSLDFDDHPFETSKATHDCDLCGAKDSYLDEVITDDAGGRMFVCSDTDFCAGRRAKGHAGRLGGDQKSSKTFANSFEGIWPETEGAR